MKVLLLAAIAVAISAPAAGQASGPAPQQGTSSWTIRRDSRGYLVRTLVNRTFAFLPGPDLLFEQEVRTQFGPWEGDKGRVKISAWAASKTGAAYPRRLWSVELDGGEARLRDNLYEVVEHGCCGARDTRIWLSPETGARVAMFTEGPVHLYQQRESEYDGFDIVYLSDWGAAGSAAMQADSLVWGELLLVAGDTVLSRATLRTNKADKDGPAHMSVVVGRDSAVAGELELRPGQNALVRIANDERVVAIPVVGRSFTLAGAALPPSVTVKVDGPYRSVLRR